MSLKQIETKHFQIAELEKFCPNFIVKKGTPFILDVK